KDDLALEGEVFRPLVDLDADRARRQADLTDAVDVGEGVAVELDLTADVLIGSSGELGEPTERHAADAGAVDEANAHWRRLHGRGHAGTHMNGGMVFTDPSRRRDRGCP